MRTLLRSFGLLILFITFGPGLGRAQEFNATSATILDVGFDAGDLLVRFREAGLEPGSQVSYSISGNNVTTYACVSGRQASMMPVNESISYDFSLPARRSTVGQTVDIEEAEHTGLTCPGGSLVLYRVDYSGMQITDQTNNLSTPINSGHFSMTFCNLNKNPKSCPPPT